MRADAITSILRLFHVTLCIRIGGYMGGGTFAWALYIDIRTVNPALGHPIDLYWHILADPWLTCANQLIECNIIYITYILR